MFGFSFGELVVIAVVGLLVLGPEDLPKAVCTLSRAWRSMQLMMQDVRRQFDEAIGQEELAELRQLREALKGKKNFLIDEQGRYRETYDIGDLMQRLPAKQVEPPPPAVKAPDEPA